MPNCITCGGRSIKRENEEVKCTKCSGKAKLMQPIYVRRYQATPKGKEKKNEANTRYRNKFKAPVDIMVHIKPILTEDIIPGGLRTPEDELELEMTYL